MEKEESISYLYNHAREEDLGTYSAWGQGPDTEGYNCHGCKGEFISTWPRWEKPTDETFPHEKGCEYLAMKKALNI